MEILNEGNVKFHASIGEVNSEMEVFYNPFMKTNRDIAVIVLKNLGKQLERKLDIGLPMEASGLRGIRFLKETDTVEKVHFNDLNKKAVKTCEKNLKLNKIPKKKFELNNVDANNFFLSNRSKFDYIDIDPFGSPINFFFNSLNAIKHKGVIAVTATDLAPLLGARPETCFRRYFFKSFRSDFEYELGLRILITALKRIAMAEDIYLKVVLAYYERHYIRIYFQVFKSKGMINKSDKEFGNFSLEKGFVRNFESGQLLYVDKLKDKEFFRTKEENKLFNLIMKELDVFSYYNLELLRKNFRLALTFGMEEVQNRLERKGFKFSRTHYGGNFFKTDCSLSELMKIL